MKMLELKMPPPESKSEYCLNMKLHWSKMIEQGAEWNRIGPYIKPRKHAASPHTHTPRMAREQNPIESTLLIEADNVWRKHQIC